MPTVQHFDEPRDGEYIRRVCKIGSAHNQDWRLGREGSNAGGELVCGIPAEKKDGRCGAGSLAASLCPTEKTI